MFNPAIPESLMCFWYLSGDTNRPGLLSLITGTSDEGIITVAVFGKFWSRHQCYDGVRHMDDPELKKHPNHAKENGCWGYLPGQEPVTRRANLEPASEDAKDRIAEMAEKGMNSQEIAAELGEGWSHQRVNAILRNLQPA